MSDELWNKAANVINSAGPLPIPITGTVIDLLKMIMTEAHAEFILNFNTSLSYDQIKERSGLDDASLNKFLDELMHTGVITGIPSSKTGIMVYRLMPPFPGIFEFTLMRGETGERDKKLARLFDQLFNEVSDLVQNNYDQIVSAFKVLPAVDRIVPVESQLGEHVEVFYPSEQVNAIVDKNDVISVAHCYCRHEKDLLGQPCKTTKKRENCLMFGKTATFAVSQKFARQITKEEAKKILREAENEGLVHKAFHAKLNPEKAEEAICNCCGCCCGTFQLYYRGASAIHSITSYVAEVLPEQCVTCGACLGICPIKAISLDDFAMIDSDKCLGCGLCAHHCALKAISMKRIGPREVFIEPPKLQQANS